VVETWRIETNDTVHAVEVVRRGACWAVASDGDHTVLHSTPRVAVQAWAFRHSVMGMILAPGEPTRAEAVAAAQIVGAEAVRDAAMSVADDLAGDDDEWAHELMERVACAVAKIRAGGV
jgi:hypothetical protein